METNYSRVGLPVDDQFSAHAQNVAEQEALLASRLKIEVSHCNYTYIIFMFLFFYF